MVLSAAISRDTGVGPMDENEALALHAQAQEMQAAGGHAGALPLLRRVAEYFESVGPLSPDLANVLSDEAESLMLLFRLDEAERSARQAAEIVNALRDRLDPASRAALIPRAFDMWGRALRDLGRYEEAAAALGAAIREAGEMLGEEHAAMALHLNEYGVLCKYWGRFDEGERCYRRALRIVADEYGPDALETASIYHNLGGLEHARGDFARGEPLSRKAYEIRRNALGEEYPATVADAVAWAGLLDGLGRFDESVRVYLRALAYYETELGPDHFEVAAVLNNLAMARAAQGDPEEALRLLTRCLDIKMRLFAAEHPEVVLTRKNRDSLLSSRG